MISDNDNKPKCRKFHPSIRKHFLTAGGHTLEQVVQRGGEVFILGDLQNLTDTALSNLLLLTLL